jgi:hypothetical protein
MTTARAIRCLAALAAVTVTTTAGGGLVGVRAQGGFGFGGPGTSREVALVPQFDKNKDGRLDAAERKAARAALGGGGGGQRFRGFGGGPAGTPEPGPKLSPADVRTYGNEPLYDPMTLRTLFLEFEGADWEQELADFNNTDVEVPANLVVDGRTYKDVGVHFRGASSFMMVSDGYKRSLNLSVDFVHGKQDLAGYRTLNLLNAATDPTFLRAVLYQEIARSYLPVPRMNYVRVVINGESWGVYVNAQQFNKDFLRDWFGADGGVRWKVPGSPRGNGGLEYLGESPAAYQQLYEIKTKDNPKAWADLANLTRVLNQTAPDQLEAALQPILDIDGVLKFLALEVALVNTDGYWTRASDYSIYQDPKGKFHIIPHDMNEGLGVGNGGGGRRGFGGGSGPSLDPLVAVDDPSKPLRSRLLAVPALRERYLSYVRDIAERWLDWKTLEPLVTKYQALIAADVKADNRKLFSTEAFTSDVAGLKSFADRRRTFLLAQRVSASPAIPAAAE